MTDDYTLYAVYKKMPYKVTFNNNAGTSTSSSYTSLTVYADQNQKITLPAVPKAKGYTESWMDNCQRRRRNRCIKQDHR
ncbi:MAG: hypothetical protein ACLUTA_13410 [Blautia wexlerae]